MLPSKVAGMYHCLDPFSAVSKAMLASVTHAYGKAIHLQENTYKKYLKTNLLVFL
jgi:hypothetical protein